MPVGGGLALIEALRARAIRKGVSYFYETTAISLERDDGRVEAGSDWGGAEGTAISFKPCPRAGIMVGRTSEIDSPGRRKAAWILLAVDPGCAYLISAQQRSAAVLGLFKPVEQAPGIGACQGSEAVRLILLDGIPRERPLGAKVFRFPLHFTVPPTAVEFADITSARSATTR
jgi:hypothetical protein